MDATRHADGSRKPSARDFAGLLAIALAFAAIVASYADFTPYWDAKGYYDCIAHAAQAPFDLLNYRCFGHTTIGYLFLPVLTQYLAPWHVSLAYAANALLGLASIAAFHELLRLLFPGRPGTEYALVTALYALAPLFVVHAIFFNLDYGMAAYFVLFLYFMVARRAWLACVFAVAMLLSKETGVAAFTAAVVAYVVAFSLRSPASWMARLATLHEQLPLVIAPAVLVAYIVAFRASQPNPGSWVSAYAQVSMIRNPLDAVLNVNPADPGIRSLLADIFILNFQWLYTGVLVTAACFTAARAAGGRGVPDQTRPALAGTGLFLGLLLIQLLYVVTRYRDYNNARYVLIVSPVLIAAFYRALLFVMANGAARRAFVGATAALVMLSNFRTLDFVSKSVFGTFSLGSHALLDMPSMLAGPRMDSTVYNLESLQYGYLLTAVMQDLRPAPLTVFFMGDTTYNFPPQVDARSYALTVDPSRALPLSILSQDGDVRRDSLRMHIAGGNDRFFYLAFANADNHQLRMLTALYPVEATKTYSRHGYTLDVYTFHFAPAP